MKWSAKTIQYRKESRIAVIFDKDPELIARIKQIDNYRWNPKLKYWHVPDTEENRARFKIASLEDTVLSGEGEEQLKQFISYLRSKRYSANTVKTYAEALKSFLLFYRKKEISEITNEDVIAYNNGYLLHNNFSASYQNQIVSAVKLYFATIREKKIDVAKIHRPRREKILPNVLSREEIKGILEAHQNIKHRAMLSLIYSCGLRRSEGKWSTFSTVCKYSFFI